MEPLPASVVSVIEMKNRLELVANGAVTNADDCREIFREATLLWETFMKHLPDGHCAFQTLVRKAERTFIYGPQPHIEA
jgi:hypothetical protein